MMQVTALWHFIKELVQLLVRTIALDLLEPVRTRSQRAEET